MGWPTPAGQPVTLVASGISSLLVLSDAISLPTMSDTWMFFYYIDGTISTALLLLYMVCQSVDLGYLGMYPSSTEAKNLLIHC